MIYGVSAFVNRCNFKLKGDKQVETAFSELSFFTNKTEAKKHYVKTEQRWREIMTVHYWNRENKGSCSLFIADVDNGRIREYGKVILKGEI